MIFEISLIIVAIILVVFTTYHFEKEIEKERSKISIKESLDLVQIPIITFQVGETKLNFVLDSGSSHSHISKVASKLITGTPIDTDYTYTTSSGQGESSKSIESVLEYKNREFRENLYINESIEDSFNNIKEECGIQLHGILGSDFLKKHKYILDFAELVAYHK